MEFPRQNTQEQHLPVTNEQIELGYNRTPVSAEVKTVGYRVVEAPIEAKPLAQEAVTWQEARAGDVRNIIFDGKNEQVIEQHVIRFMQNEAESFASTKTGEIALPTTDGLSAGEQQAVLARALIESVRETERKSEEDTIRELREELSLVYGQIRQMENAQQRLAQAQAQVEQYRALVTPDMLTQAQVIADLEARNAVLETQTSILRSRAERPARTMRLNTGLFKTAMGGIGLHGHA